MAAQNDYIRQYANWYCQYMNWYYQQECNKSVDPPIEENSIEISQNKTQSEKITRVNLPPNLPSIPNIILGLHNLQNLRDRLINFYVQNVTTTSFEVVTNMQANIDRFVADIRGNGEILSNLVLIDGNPAASFTNTRGFHRSPAPVVLRANDSIGATTMTNITKHQLVGSSLGIVSQAPSSVFIENDMPVFTRSDNIDGTGTWYKEEVICYDLFGAHITRASNPVDLYGAPYFIVDDKTDPPESVINTYTCVNDNPGSWVCHHFAIPSTCTLENGDTTPMPTGASNPIVVYDVPAFFNATCTSANHYNWGQPIVLNFVAANSYHGFSWSGRQVDTFSSLPGNLSAIMAAGEPCVAHFGQNTHNDSVYSEGVYFELRNAGGVWERHVIYQTNIAGAQHIYCAIIDGHPAVVYSMNSIEAGNTITSIYYSRALNVTGSSWPAEPDFILSGSADSTKLLSFASINGNPAITYLYNNQYRYLRAGSKQKFVEDAVYTANWNI